MAYIPSECTIEQYNKAIYSEDARHKLYIKVGETILDNPDEFCERLELTNYLLDEGSKTFHLDNLVSNTIELILHDYKLENLKEEMEIKLGTYINDTIGYVYVPLGLYKIQDNPTTDKNKTTYKLRDRSINFDFNYNGKTLIDNSEHIDENGNQYVTKLEVLKDICLQANVNYVGDEDFIGYDDPIAIYDNTVNARVYLSYIFEQAGRIGTIDRNGDLTSVVINNNLSKQILPFDLVESYVIGDKYKISKTIYESGVIKYEDGTEDYDNLYINGANPYIANQEQLNRIQASINGFEIDSLKISKIIGNPAIDSYDLISITNNEETYTTLGQNKLVYNGKLLQSFETNIEYEAKQSNVTKNSPETYRKMAKTEIDNVNAEIRFITAETTTIKEDLTTNYYSVEQTNQLLQNSQTGITNTFSEAGGNNIFRNTGLWFKDEEGYEFWEGNAEKTTNDLASNKTSILLQNGSFIQEQEVSNGNYSISFYYRKLIELANASVLINDVEYLLDSLEFKQFYTGKKDEESNEYITQPINVTTNHLKIEFRCDTNNAVEIYDLMANKGSIKLAYSQNQNETTTDTVNISKGITITSSNMDVEFKANADGIRTLDKNGNKKTEFTDKGMITEEAEIKTEATIVGILRQRVNDQVWDSFIG